MMAGIGDNNPPVIVELTKEQAAFMLENCNINMDMALGLLQSVSRDNAEKLIANIELFKGIKTAVEKGL